MDWENERYIRVYTRDTGDILAIGWEGRAVLWELMRKVDRAGVLDESDPAIIAEMLRLPHEVTSIGLERLEKRSVVTICDGYIVFPNFLDAQESKQSDKHRARESRGKRRDRASAGKLSRNVTPTVTKRDTNVTVSHSVSQRVTPSLAVPTLTNNNTLAQSATERVKFDIAAAYKFYPRKQGKAKGMAAARKAVTTQEDYDRLLACCQHMALAYSDPEDKQFCPYFSSFVSAKSWRDEEWPSPGERPRAESRPAERML